MMAATKSWNTIDHSNPDPLGVVEAKHDGETLHARLTVPFKAHKVIANGADHACKRVEQCEHHDLQDELAKCGLATAPQKTDVARTQGTAVQSAALLELDRIS